MAATVRGAFVLIDQASSTLKKIEAQALKTQAAVEGVGAALDAHEAQANKTAAAMDKAGKASASFEEDLNRQRKTTQGATQDLHNMGTATDTAGKGFDKIGQRARKAEQDLKRVRTESSSLRKELMTLGGAMIGAAAGTLFGPIGTVAGAAAGGAAGLAGQSGLAAVVKSKEGAKELASAWKDVKDAFGAVGQGFSFLKIGTLVTGIQPAIAAIMSLGGAVVAFLPRIAQLGQAFYAIPGAVSVGAQAFGTLGLAMQGVSGAVQQAMQMQNQWSYNQQQYAQQVIDAQNSVITSQNALTNAVYSQNLAQIQLTVARRDATRALQDMEFQAKSAILAETQAGLNVMQARQQLARDMSTAGTSQLQISQDRLAVEQAILQQQHQQVTTSRAQIDYARARRHDATSQPAMQLAAAQHQATQSIFETSQAQRALARSQYELNHLYQIGNTGVQGYMQALRGLQPAQRAFVQWLTGPLNGSNKNSILNQFQRMQQAAGQGLFPGLEQGVTKFSRSFGVIDGILTKTGRAIGGTLNRLLGKFSDPNWLQSVGSNNVKVISTFGDALVHLAGVFKDMVKASGPFLQWVAHGVDQWAKYREQVDGTHAGMQKLEGRFRTLERAIKDVFTWLHNLWLTFKNVGEVADKALGGTMWKGAINGTAAWAKWAEAQNKLGTKSGLYKWFHDLLPTLRAFKTFIEAIAKALVGLSGPGGQRGATGLLTSLTALIGPLTTVLRALATDAPYFQRIMVWLANIVASLAKIPGIGMAIGGIFAVALIGRWVTKLGEGAKHLANIVGLMGRMRRVGGMASPGVTDRNWRTRAGSALGFGRGGQLAQALELSRTWGRSSETGPGSYSNPLVVEVLGGGGTGGGSSRSGRGLSAAEEAAARDAGKVSRLDKVNTRLVDSKIPGTTALASGLDSVAKKFGGVADKLKPIGDVLGKVAGPLAGAGIAFGLQSGSLHRRGVAAAHALDPTGWIQGIAGLGAGLPGVGGLFNSISHIPSITGLEQNLIQSLMGKSYVLKGQALTAYQDVGRIGVPGLPAGVTPIGPNGRPIAAPPTAMGQAGQDAQKYLYQLWHDLATGQQPRAAVQQVAKSMLDELGNLTPQGRQEVQAALVDWGNTFVKNTPSMKQPVDSLMGYILGSWGNTQQQINQVNSQILGTSTTQWQEIYTALTNPAEKAQAKLTGVFGKIQQEAIGALMSMGLKRSDATMLLKHPTDANAWMNWAQGGGSASSYSNAGSGIGHRNATGGRVYGNNLRDVYAFGGNLLGGGELVVNRHQEQDANARLIRHGEPTIGSIVNNVQRPHWMATGGRARRATGGYALPLPRSMMGGSWSIDMGVDINGGTPAIANQPLYAVAPGTIVQEGLQGFGPNAPVLHLDTPIRGHGNVYYGHAGADTVGIGHHVAAGQQISRVGAGIVGLSSGPHLEIGFGPPFSNGNDMNAFLRQIMGGRTVSQTGAPAGAPGIAGKRRNPIKLTVPAFGGIGGIPAVLAGRAASAYAKTLQSGLNTGLGSAGGGLSGNFTGGGSAQQNEALGRRMMLASGWGGGQWPYLMNLWTKESGWRTTADNPTSGAYGIAQALPASKYNTAGSDWRTNPATQIKWGLEYIRSRYGSPSAAWAHETAFNWYDRGGRVNNAGWFGDGGSFVTTGPTVFGAGERGPEKVTVERAGSATGGRPIHIEIHKVEVHREGDIRRIIDQELAQVAESLAGTS